MTGQVSCAVLVRLPLGNEITLGARTDSIIRGSRRGMVGLAPTDDSHSEAMIALAGLPTGRGPLPVHGVHVA